MLTYILRFVVRFLAGILIQQVLRFLAAMVMRPPRPARPEPEPRSRTPQKPKTTINPRNIEEGKFEDIPGK
ncbi:MAG: hypothetical protein F4207_07105 [Gemmatimonadetes bacterium]|nr:hypothetical protein [Gemmatimonadota bacterium]MYA78580.1 hypothetical protein [Gemmatimonadota bacterium]MYG16177.1 hypothetical protein [Gemmatimonadota bacterium]MYH19680.1 hypothetical protein [Gemmatimonadota bacterium]MYK99062.1 hypothetical protein [Gemmatimonadota bacterium]